MNEHQLSLPDDVYQNLLAAATMEGVTPADWIAAHLPAATEKPVAGDISDLIGSVDSRQPRQRPEPTPFEAILIDKMAKQGVHIS